MKPTYQDMNKEYEMKTITPKRTSFGRIVAAVVQWSLQLMMRIAANIWLWHQISTENVME